MAQCSQFTKRIKKTDVMKKLQIISTALLAFAFTLSACNKEEVQMEEEEAAPRSFKVSMTDAPGDFQSLVVEIESVEAYMENSGWVTLNNETQFVSVLDLTNGIETSLALQQDAEFGTYTKLRIKFGESNKLMVETNVEIGGLITSSVTTEFDLEFEGSNEIEIEIDEEVSAEQGVDILLDFNVAQSIQEDGEAYIIDPMITEISDRSTGVQGRVEGTISAALVLTNGDESISSYTDASGQFLIRGVEDGTFDLIVYPEQEEGEEMMEEILIEGIVVTEGQITNAGTIKF